MWNAKSLFYGLTPQVDGDLGGNATTRGPGDVLPAPDGVALSTNTALANFLTNTALAAPLRDNLSAVVQVGTQGGTGNVNGVNVGFGRTGDALIRLSGNLFLERGFYDFRVTADDGFRLRVEGQTVLEYDGNQGPTARTFTNLQINDSLDGLQSFEFLYWEQGGNGTFQVEFKRTSDATFQTLDASNIALFGTANAPVFDPTYQTVTETAVDRLYQIETGLALTGDSTNETFTGSALRDFITAGGGDDIVNGGAGADSLFGEAGNDTINGGAGADIIDGGLGNDTMVGGLGDDFYTVDSATDVVIEVANEGIDTVNTTLTTNLTTQYANVENVTLLGNLAINATGNAGVNILVGNTADNVITGGAGNDRLAGGAGSDSLTGGADNDLFIWRLEDRGTPGTPAIDTITDFNTGIDALDLRDLLVGERSTVGSNAAADNVGTLLNYIDINFNAVTGNTEIRISSTGGFTGGTYVAGAEDQSIILAGQNLFTITGAAAGNETALLNNLLTTGRLFVD